ncbi:MAG: aminotransferase class I/II-fold pyridoxal phosphate-dependent enzyme, partial [Pirellulales bacterium]
SNVLIEYLKYTTPGFIFTTGLSPPMAAGALEAIRVLEEQPERLDRLRENSQLLLELARGRGFNTGTSTGTPVVPVIMGNSLLALRLSHAMFERGVNVMPILYPAVEESAARLRFFVSSEHTAAQIRETVAIMAEEVSQLDPDYLVRHPAEPAAGAAVSNAAGPG